MIRNLTIVAVASFVLALGCLGGAFALGGRDIAKNGWSFPADWNIQVNDDDDSVRIGPGHVERGETSTRQVAWVGGDALQIDLPAEVTFTQAAPGADAFVKIVGPKALVDRVVVENGRVGLKDGDEGGALRINGHGFHVSGDSDRLSIEITAPGVRAFTVNGSGDLYLKAYDQPSLVLEVNGSGGVDAQGKAKTVELRVSGSGEIDLRGLDTGDAKVAVSGSGEAHLAPHGAAEVDLSGSGDVYLTAKPTVLTSNVAGSGEVHQDW
jgi:hypothetical protein